MRLAVFQDVLRSRAKALLVRSRLYRVLAPFSDMFMRLSMIPVFAEWCVAWRRAPALPGPRENLYAHVGRLLHLDSRPIAYLEFGVFEGASFRWWFGFQSRSIPSFRRV